MWNFGAELCGASWNPVHARDEKLNFLAFYFLFGSQNEISVVFGALFSEFLKKLSEPKENYEVGWILTSSLQIYYDEVGKATDHSKDEKRCKMLDEMALHLGHSW